MHRSRKWLRFIEMFYGKESALCLGQVPFLVVFACFTAVVSVSSLSFAVGAVGKDTKAITEYIQCQLEEYRMAGQLILDDSMICVEN